MMSTNRDRLLGQLKTLRAKAQDAGLIEPDTWSLLDEVWSGPEVDLEELAMVADDTITTVRQAYVEGRIEEEVVLEALGLAKTLLPFALKALGGVA